MKKFWALLLAALLVVSILPVSALAARRSGADAGV